VSCAAKEKNGSMRRISAQAGFSLIEVQITLSILAIGLLAVAALQVSAHMSSRASAEISHASQLASSQMEVILRLPFLHSELDPASNPHSKSSGKYLIRWTVVETDLNADGIFESKTVDLAVAWKKLLPSGPSQNQVNIAFIKHED
jgi:type IV pilus modification protein PilV